MNKKKISNILEFWGELETSFEIQVKRLNKIRKENGKKPVVTRLDYIKAISDYDEESNTTRLDHLKTVMNEELGTYTTTELEMYSELIEIFTGVDSLLKEGKIEEINDLRAFVAIAVNTASLSKTITRTLDPNFFNRLRPMKEQYTGSWNLNPKYLDEIYSMNETFGDTFILKDGKVESHLASRTIADSFILSDEQALDELINVVQLPFAKKTLNGIRKLREVGKLKFGMLFLSDKYFTINEQGNLATVTIGDKKTEVKVPATNVLVGHDGKGKYYMGKLNTGLDSITVVLVG